MVGRYWSAIAIALMLGMVGLAHGEKWAIIVGINEYQDPGIPDLKYAVADAQLVHRALTEAPDGFGATNVILLTDGQADPLRRPTRSGIIRFLSTWFAEPAPEDTVLFYFAGHGVERQGQSFLLPSDATFANPGLTGLQLATVKEILRQCKARKKLLIVDSCHSGAGRSAGGMGAATAKALFEASAGLVTLASCEQKENSYEWVEKGQGAFSYFLAEGLTGGADADGDGCIVASELNRYVWDRTRKWAAGRGFQQHPKYISAVQGDIMLVRVPPGGPQPPPVVTPTPRPPTPQPVPSGKPWERPGSQVGQEIAGPHGGKLVWVPGGRFRMGSNDGGSNEQPVREVELDGFWIGKTEVTVGQWRSVMGSVPLGNTYGDSHPVVSVSWSECQQFCTKIGLSLPTEAQWEYAACGPESRRYPWGNEWDKSKCCNSDNTGKDGRTFPVGSLGQDASWCGALDMAGNVWEWCADWYQEDYYKSAPSRNPTGPTSGRYRVLRGGSWLYANPWDFRCACRGWDGYGPGYRKHHGGFRVVLAPPAPDSQAKPPAPTPQPAVGMIASHLGNHGPKFERGVTPSKLGWGGDGAAYPGQFVVNPIDSAEMVWVPAGKFRMGSTQEEIDRLWRENGWEDSWKRYASHEYPHQVELTEGFWLYKHEVTNGQYGRFLDATDYKPRYSRAEYKSHTRLPVNLVTWDDSLAYAKWVGGDLPTEAQWEYAARGPGGNLFPWGNDWDRTKCVCAEYWAKGPLDDRWAWLEGIGAKKTTGGGWTVPTSVIVAHLKPVGSFPEAASWCGALDMAGNVYEWCADWYQIDYYKSAPSRNPPGPSSGESRVYRGGSWYAYTGLCRGADRYWISPNVADLGRGLRVSRSCR